MEKKSQTGILDFILHLHPPKSDSKVTGLLPTLCMGGLSFFFMLLLLATGLLLMFYYQPGNGETAYKSLVIIQDVVPYGGLIRSIHKWAGQAMVFTIVIHLVRVILTQAYRPPREGNWVIGVLLLILTIMLDFSGYLLIGDDMARYATEIAYGLTGEIPYGGILFQRIIFGGDPTGDLGGLRIYLWHCMVLPGFIFLLTGWHFYRVRKDGGVKWPL